MRGGSRYLINGVPRSCQKQEGTCEVWQSCAVQTALFCIRPASVTLVSPDAGSRSALPCRPGSAAP